MLREDHREDPGADLQSLVAEYRGVPVAVRRVSRLEAPRHRAAAYRLSFADGRLLKGRELRDTPTAERVRYVLTHAPQPAFPRLLAQRGSVVLMEWIEGLPIEPDSVPEAHVRASADFLAALHQAPVPASCPFVAADPVTRQRARTGRHIDGLVRAGSLDARRAAALRDLLEDRLPASWQVGFVHGDLCGENLVVDRAGRVRVVDNEAVGVDACDGDLARTLYRWPLDPLEVEIFLDAYARRRSIEAFLDQFAYWALAARLGSAAHRVGAPAAVAAMPLRSLERLLEAIERGASGAALLSGSLTGSAGFPLRSDSHADSSGSVFPGDLVADP